MTRRELLRWAKASVGSATLVPPDVYAAEAAIQEEAKGQPGQKQAPPLVLNREQRRANRRRR
jgi:hypothetical protein